MVNQADSAVVNQLPETAYVILGYVGMYPNGIHGYRLGRILLHSPLGLRSVRIGQLYRVLHRLERADLVKTHVEAGGPRPARYRFTMTASGRSRFRLWLRSAPRGSGPLRDRVINRLRFADLLPPADLESLLEDAARECRIELEEIQRQRGETCDWKGAVSSLHLMAIEARLAADRRWLNEIRRVLDRSSNQSERSGLSPWPPPIPSIQRTDESRESPYGQGH